MLAVEPDLVVRYLASHHPGQYEGRGLVADPSRLAAKAASTSG